jgi:hypothetical protein
MLSLLQIFVTFLLCISQGCSLMLSLNVFFSFSVHIVLPNFDKLLVAKAHK